MSSPHVLIVLHEHQLGGATQSVLRAADHLSKDGWRFSFWAPRPSPLFDELRTRGLHVAGAPRYIDFGLRSLGAPPGPRRRLGALRPYLRALREFAAETEPDVVHANSVTTLVEGASLARRHPVVLHVHEMVPRGVRSQIIRRVAWRRLNGIIAVSQACAQTMALGRRYPRIVPEAAPVPPAPVETRDATDEFVIGSVGVISRRKGSDVFIDAAEIASARDPRLRFELVGAPTDAPDRKWGERLLERAKNVPIVHTPRADVPTAFRRWDAFALSSRRDPFPIVMLEAMAHGMAVIGTQVDGIGEQVTPGCGILVPPSDPQALAEAFVAMAGESESRRKAMGAAARDRVSSNFTVAHQAAGLSSAYRAAITPFGA